MTQPIPEWQGADRRQISYIETQLSEILGQIKLLHTAFPIIEGEIDLIGHRKHHEALIKAADAEADFWREMKLDLAKKGAWSLFIILLGLLLTGLSFKLGITK